MSYTGVHQLVRYRLGAKLKVPRPVHLKQETDAVEEFKKNWATTSSKSENKIKAKYKNTDKFDIGVVMNLELDCSRFGRES